MGDNDQGRVIGPREQAMIDAYNELKKSPAGIPPGAEGQLQNRITAGRMEDERDSATNSALNAGGSSQGGAAAAGAAIGGGVNQVGTPVNSGGFAGFFGEQRNYPIYVPTAFGDSTYAGNRQQVNDQISTVGGQPFYTAGDAAQSAGSTIDQSQQAQFRDRQLALGQQLMDQANGKGPSVAGSQLRQSTEMNLQAALAQAASSRGGNLGAAQYQLGNARANIQQQSAMQLAQARIQEQMAARSQLGDVLASGRGADIGLATNQAQLSQQNNQFNTGQTNQQGQFNATLNAEQQAQQNSTIQQLMALGYSLDQANYMAQIQQQQFAVGSLSQQIAAANNVSIANSAQGAQIGGALIGAAGAAVTGGATAAGAYAASRAAAGR